MTGVGRKVRARSGAGVDGTCSSERDAVEWTRRRRRLASLVAGWMCVDCVQSARGVDEVWMRCGWDSSVYSVFQDAAQLDGC